MNELSLIEVFDKSFLVAPLFQAQVSAYYNVGNDTTTQPAEPMLPDKAENIIETSTYK